MLQDLLYPERQPPQLVTFIGHKTKSTFCDLLFSLEPVTNHHKILLRRVPDPGDNKIPVLIADAELHYCKTLAHEGSNGAVQHSLEWHRNLPQPVDINVLAHLVYSQVLLPFSTVMCFFAKDFGGMNQVANILSFWLMILQPAPTRSRLTRVLILEDLEDPTYFDEKLSMTNFIRTLRSFLSSRPGNISSLGKESIADIEFEKRLNENFFEIRVLALPRYEDQIHSVQLKTLRTRIFQESQDAYEFRKAAKMNISANHFRGFIHYACCNFSRNFAKPFNFVRASRIPNPVPDFGQFIDPFIRLVPLDHFNVVPSIIASALRLDSFPPGAHGEQNFYNCDFFSNFEQSLIWR